MGEPADAPGSPAPIDRPILEFHQSRLAATDQVQTATITDDTGHLELLFVFDDTYYPERIDEATLSIRWYTNDDFKIHYREVHAETTWDCRWDRHPNPHNPRDHFHPPPEAATPGNDASWPADHRDVVSHVFDEIEDRIADLWNQRS